MAPIFGSRLHNGETTDYGFYRLPRIGERIGVVEDWGGTPKRRQGFWRYNPQCIHEFVGQCEAAPTVAAGALRGIPRAPPQRLRMEGGHLAVLAEDGISGTDEYGHLWGTDGKPLLRVAGLSDFTLRDHRCRAVSTELTPRWLPKAIVATLCDGAAPTVAAAAASRAHPTTMLGARKHAIKMHTHWMTLAQDRGS